MPARRRVAESARSPDAARIRNPAEFLRSDMEKPYRRYGIAPRRRIRRKGRFSSHTFARGVFLRDPFRIRTPETDRERACRRVHLMLTASGNPLLIGRGFPGRFQMGRNRCRSDRARFGAQAFVGEVSMRSENGHRSRYRVGNGLFPVRRGFLRERPFRKIRSVSKAVRNFRQEFQGLRQKSRMMGKTVVRGFLRLSGQRRVRDSRAHKVQCRRGDVIHQTFQCLTRVKNGLSNGLGTWRNDSPTRRQSSMGIERFRTPNYGCSSVRAPNSFVKACRVRDRSGYACVVPRNFTWPYFRSSLPDGRTPPSIRVSPSFGVVKW